MRRVGAKRVHLAVEGMELELGEVPILIDSPRELSNEEAAEVMKRRKADFEDLLFASSEGSQR